MNCFLACPTLISAHLIECWLSNDNDDDLTNGRMDGTRKRGDTFCRAKNDKSIPKKPGKGDQPRFPEWIMINCCWRQSRQGWRQTKIQQEFLSFSFFESEHCANWTAKRLSTWSYGTTNSIGNVLQAESMRTGHTKHQFLMLSLGCISNQKCIKCFKTHRPVRNHQGT